jgi:hypothetical protein
MGGVRAARDFALARGSVRAHVGKTRGILDQITRGYFLTGQTGAAALTLRLTAQKVAISRCNDNRRGCWYEDFDTVVYTADLLVHVCQHGSAEIHWNW